MGVIGIGRSRGKGGSASPTVKYKAANYTDLSALSGMSTGDVAIVTDEGIGGTFVYDSTLSATDNGGTIIDGWVRQWDGITLILEWFQVDEEAADNKANINKALALKPSILKGNSANVYTITSQVSAGDFDSMKWIDVNLEFDYGSFASQGVWIGTFGSFYLENCRFTSTTAANIYTHFTFDTGDKIVVNNSYFKGAQNSFIETTKVRYETRYTNSWFEDSATHGIGQVENTYVPYITVVDNCYFKDIKVYGADIHSIHSTISNSTFKNVASVGKNQRKESNALAQDPVEKTSHTLKNIVFEFDYETALHDILTTANVAAFGCGADIYQVEGVKANIVQPPVVSSGNMRYFTCDAADVNISNVHMKIENGSTSTLPTDLFYFPIATNSVNIHDNNFDLNGLLYNIVWDGGITHQNFTFSDNTINIGATETAYTDNDVFFEEFNAVNMTVTGNIVKKHASNTKVLHFMDFASGTASVTNLTSSNNIVVNATTDVVTGVTNLKAANNIGSINNSSGLPAGVTHDGTTLTNTATAGKIVQNGLNNQEIAAESTNGGAAMFRVKNSTTEWHFEASSNIFRLTETGVGHAIQFNEGNSSTIDFQRKVKVPSIQLNSLNTAPASAGATGTAGEIRVTATHIYVCTATNTWVRAELTTW